MNERNYIREPREETTWEVSESKRIFKENPNGLRDFWNQRYRDTYSAVLEDISEFGRHGAIYEYLCRLIKSGLILEVGCGTGILAEIISKDKFTYEGIDISSEALKTANNLRKHNSVTFQLISFEKFDTNKKYDAIVFNEVIYYLDYRNTVTKINKLLNPDGIAIVSIFEFDVGHSILDSLRSELNVISEIVVSNPNKNLQWNVAAFKL